MKFIRVYQNEDFQAGKAYQLDKASSNHLIKVLRLKNKFHFTIFNGRGFEFAALLEINDKRAIAHIQSCSKVDNESNLNIHLLQGISKGDRMDFVIQKSIELGVTSITPVITDRTVVNLKGDKQLQKLNHWQAIAIGACEQSGRNYLPTINPVSFFSDVIKAPENGTRIMLDPVSSTKLKSFNADKNIEILIGPEGGLSENEIAQARENHFEGIKLGPRILRTETAALAAITSVQLLWGDL